MLWPRLMHWLFGWEYALVRVRYWKRCRISYAPDGRRLFNWYGWEPVGSLPCIMLTPTKYGSEGGE